MDTSLLKNGPMGPIPERLGIKSGRILRLPKRDVKNFSLFFFKFDNCTNSIHSGWLLRHGPKHPECTSASGTCGDTGDAGDTDTNLRKNRTDVPAAYHDVAWAAVGNLSYPVAPKSRANWSANQLNQIAPFEGVAVRVTGYLVALKVQTSGNGESTNCHFTKAAEVDWHMALVENAGEGEADALVV